MNILIVTNLYPLPWEPNRATFNKQQFDRLAQQHNVRVLVPVAWRDYWANRAALKAANSSCLLYVCFWYTPKVFYSLFGVFMFLSIWWRARGWIRAVAVDVVLGSWIFPDGYAAARIAAKLRKPYYLKAHGSDINLYTEEPLRRRQIAQVCAGARGVIAVSKALQQKIIELGVSAEQVVQIYNGVDPVRFYPVEDALRKPYFVYVGNLKKDKGVTDLMEAYAEYCQAGGKMALVFVGEGPMNKPLKVQIVAMQLHNRVELRGALPHQQAAVCIRESAAVILPSYHEGVPNVLLEAAASGVPVVATRVGGIPEVVIEGETGVLVEPGNISQLQLALQQVSKQASWDQSAIAQHGACFTWENNLSAVNALFLSSSSNQSASKNILREQL